ETSPELRRLQAESAAKEFAVAAEKGALYPRIDFVAQYALLARFNNYDEFFNRFQRHNGQVGLALSAPIFAGSGVQARVAQARTEARRLEVETRSRRADIELEAERLHFEREQAAAALRLAKVELDVARQSLDVLLAQFDE